jgi:hypothetical protein
VASVPFNATKVLVNSDPLSAFLYNQQAYKLYPLDMHIRHQYYMSLYKLMQRPNVTIDPAAADRMFEIATSAGRHPGTLMIRADYLITNHKDPTALIAELRRKATLQPGTWALEKHYEETLVRRALFDSFFGQCCWT